MKKIVGVSKSDNYYSVHLYRDDIEEIISVLSETSDEITIADNNYVYDSLDELISQKGLNPKKVFISSAFPKSVSIHLELKSIWLSCSISDKNSLYAYDRIRDILERRRSILSRIFNFTVGIISSAFILIFFICIPSDLHKVLAPNDWVRVLLMILLFGIPTLSFALRMGCFSSFNLIRSHKRTNFFSRQKDDLIKIVIGAIIGALLTLLISIFT